MRQDRGWKPFRDPHWVDFHKRWWGHNGKTRLESIKKDRMLEVTPYEEIWLELSLLRTSRGWLYVREEYELMYDRMVIASANRDVPGVVMTGQPGIGTQTPSFVAFRRIDLLTAGHAKVNRRPPYITPCDRWRTSARLY